MNEPSQKTPLKWEPCHSVNVGGVTVNVNVCKGYRDRYSIAIVRHTPNSPERPYSQFFGVFIEAANGQATLVKSIASFTYEALTQAEEWIVMQCQSRETEILNERVEKDFERAAKDPNSQERARQHKRAHRA